MEVATLINPFQKGVDKLMTILMIIITPTKVNK
jgi:hypothetical protein